MRHTSTPVLPIRDEHSILLWQTCAYAEDLDDAAGSARRLTPAYDALLEFLHYRLLPYLADEERDLRPERLRDDHLQRLLVGDHERLRADVDNVEASRTRRLLTIATATLVDRLDRHVRREETWLADPQEDSLHGDLPDWALPLLLGDVVDVDVLPPDGREGLVRRRLTWMRPGDIVRLESSHDLHPLWRQDHASDRDGHVWVYEREGPSRWTVRITRRAAEDA